MAATIARTTTRTLIVLVGLSPGRRTSTIQSMETSRGDVSRVDSSATRGLGTGYAGRIPRFAYFAKHREESTSRTASPQGLATTTPVMGQSIEEGAR
jgi:hypothetical protein